MTRVTVYTVEHVFFGHVDDAAALVGRWCSGEWAEPVLALYYHHEGGTESCTFIRWSDIRAIEYHLNAVTSTPQ